MEYNITTFEKAFFERDVNKFIDLTFPEEWDNVAKELKSLDLKFSESSDWVPAWTDIPLTLRGNESDILNMYFRSVVFRVHDLIHNLWAQTSNLKTYPEYQLAGEIATLLIAEVEYIRIISSKTSCDEVKRNCAQREADWNYGSINKDSSFPANFYILCNPLFNLPYVQGKTEKIRKFVNYFRPMLQKDYENSSDNVLRIAKNNLTIPQVPMIVDTDEMWQIYRAKVNNFIDIRDGVGKIHNVVDRKDKVKSLPDGWS